MNKQDKKQVDDDLLKIVKGFIDYFEQVDQEAKSDEGEQQ